MTSTGVLLSIKNETLSCLKPYIPPSRMDSACKIGCRRLRSTLLLRSGGLQGTPNTDHSRKGIYGYRKNAFPAYSGRGEGANQVSSLAAQSQGKRPPWTPPRRSKAVVGKESKSLCIGSMTGSADHFQSPTNFTTSIADGRLNLMSGASLSAKTAGCSTAFHHSPNRPAGYNPFPFPPRNFTL
jgi:hypothetical protein